MSRKSLILSLTVLGILVACIGVAITFLYSESDVSSGERHEVSYEGRRSCITAIPSDAVLVSCFRNASVACTSVLSAFDFPATLAEKMEDGTLTSLKKCPMAVSLHYVGKLYPLYVFNADRMSEAADTVLSALAREAGLFTSKTGDFVVLSESETLVRSSVRHYEKKVSVSDAPGFDEAAASVDGDNLLFISNLHSQKLVSSFFPRKISRHSAFYEHFSDWLAFEIDIDGKAPLALTGEALYDGDSDEFMSVLEDCGPAVSEVAGVLPSYTLSFVTLPFKDREKYVSAYKSYVDSRQGLQGFMARQRELGASAGIMPEELFKALGVKETASAAFVVGSRLEKVNLIRTTSKDASLIFKGNGEISLKGYSPAVHEWAYPSFTASVYGNFFSLPDESCFTYVDGWIITGSKAAIEEYVSKSALGYTLQEYMTDAARGDLFSSSPSLAMVYVSLTEDKDVLAGHVKPEMLEYLASITEGCDVAPVLMSVSEVKDAMHVSIGVDALSLKKTEAPVHERDTVVTVPSGPFKVKNSGTGKMNTFYQNAQKAICLRDENGKDLWGVPFGKSLCGTAHNVDFYANGKLQILFGAGSSIYLIDRLGRYVKGFPLDLGKEIVLGPDVYDFSGARKYNIMVLHKDNTIQMYNLKGVKPQAWKGITSSETIKSLPERLTLGGNDFWIVRTSIQTLIYPFYGGEPLTVLEGNHKIRPDSEIEPVDGTSVRAVSYDGKTRTIKLK